MSTLRLRAAQALLAAPGVSFLFEGLGPHGSTGAAIFGLTMIAGAGLLGRRSVTSQVLARGIAWMLFAPMTVGIVLTLVMSHRLPEVFPVLLAAATGGALALSRPMLHTEEAKRGFAPLACRGWFLAASTMAVALAVMFSGVAASHAGADYELPWSVPLILAAFAASLLGSALGVARMKSWGVVLGGATSLIALLASAAVGSRDTVLASLLALGAIPGVMMATGVVAARWRVAARGASSATTEIGATSEVVASVAPREARARIEAWPAPAAHELDALDDEGLSVASSRALTAR